MKVARLPLLFSALLTLVVASCDDDDNERNSITPRVDFTYSPEAPVDGDEIVFTATEDEASSDVVSWLWSFNDRDSTTSTEPNPTFVYDSAGTYDVSLMVEDASGNAYKIAKPVTVGEFPAVVVWEFTNETPVDSYNQGSSAPLIGDDGTIYYVESNGAENSRIVAVTDQGETAALKWASEALGNDVNNAPSMGPDGNIYINSWTGSSAIIKVSGADGSIMWRGDIGTGVSNNTPAVDSQGNTYHGSRSQPPNGGAYSWTSDGQKRWEITGVGAFYAAPVLSSDESTVYFLNTNEGMVWAVNTSDGTLKWEAPAGLGNGIHGPSLSMDAEGTIYYTNKTHVVAVTDNGTTGAVKWSAEVNDPSNSGVVVAPDGTLYTGSVGGLVSINPADGSIRWTYADAEISESVPAVDVNGNVYVGTTDGRFLIVSASGQLEKAIELTEDVVNSPTIASDGSVYIEALDDDVIKLFKISVPDGGPADSAWPTKGQNVKSTGKAM